MEFEIGEYVKHGYDIFKVIPPHYMQDGEEVVSVENHYKPNGVELFSSNDLSHTYVSSENDLKALYDHLQSQKTGSGDTPTTSTITKLKQKKI
jgi:hypothetical protein